MKGCIAIAIVVLALSAAKPAPGSGRVDGRTFLMGCEVDLDYYRKSPEKNNAGPGFSGNCVIYLRGFRDAAALSGWKAFCIPTRTSNAELVTAVVDVLRKKRNLAEIAYFDAALAGLREAFPCTSDASPRK